MNLEIKPFANLQEANLQGANLLGAKLQGANLQGANLQEANLQEANLQEANLQGANLQGAKLQGANLQGANLWGANLQGANLWGASLWGANLQGANLWGANLWGAIFFATNISQIKRDEDEIKAEEKLKQIITLEQFESYFNYGYFNEDQITFSINELVITPQGVYCIEIKSAGILPRADKIIHRLLLYRHNQEEFFKIAKKIRI